MTTERADTPHQVFERYLDAITAQRWDELPTLYADDAVVEHPLGPPDHRILHGRDELCTHFTALRDMGSPSGHLAGRSSVRRAVGRVVSIGSRVALVVAGVDDVIGSDGDHEDVASPDGLAGVCRAVVGELGDDHLGVEGVVHEHVAGLHL